MKRLFKRVAVLSSAVLVTYAGLVLIIVALGIDGWLRDTRIISGQGFTLKKAREIKNYSNVDILFLGSSNVYRGIDVRLFEENGVKAFNWGTSSQSPYNSYFLLKEYLPVVKPKHVVLDLYWPVASGDGSESTLDILSNHPVTSNMIEMAVRTHNMLTIRNLAAVCFSRLLKPLDQVEVKIKKSDHGVYVPGGFVSSDNNDSKKKSQKITDLIKLPSDLQLEYIDKIVGLCKASNTNLMFILVPVSKTYKNNLKNYNEYKTTITDIAKKNNITFIDYNENSKLSLSSTRDYMDLNHLNAEGAVKFTELLLRDFNTFTAVNRNTVSSIRK